jgi:hypothetical protein
MQDGKNEIASCLIIIVILMLLRLRLVSRRFSSKTD